MYKNKYFIGLYDNNDETVAILEDKYELAAWLETSVRSATSMLTKVVNGKQTTVNSDGKLLYIYLIDMTEE